MVSWEASLSTIIIELVHVLTFLATLTWGSWWDLVTWLWGSEASDVWVFSVHFIIGLLSCFKLI